MPDGKNILPTDRPAWFRFLSVIEALRGEGGCPWDREQTYESLTRYVIEEAYELVGAAQGGDPKKIEEELGDLLLQIGLYCQIGMERGDFTPDGVIQTIIDKLTRRHPHVFGDEVLSTPEAVAERWAEIKRTEPGRYEKKHSLMDEVPQGLPALLLAQRQQEVAAGVGFDWDSAHPVYSKVEEELEEVRVAQESGTHHDIDGEIGDLLYACVNLSRKLGVDASSSLLSAVGKFSRRFRAMEREAERQGMKMAGSSLEYLDSLWEQVKGEER